MAGVSADTAIMHQTATTSVNIASQIHGIISSTDAALQGAVLGGQWKGAAAQQAVQAWVELMGQLVGLEQKLANIGTALGGVKDNYLNTDEEQYQNMRRVAGEVSGIHTALNPTV